MATIITPQTEVKLLEKVPLVNNYQDTVDFTSVSAQTSWFNSFVKFSYSDFTYQRATASIRVPEPYDNLININYAMYRNIGYTQKWFYAFVTDMRYINPGLTELDIEMDVMQTWLFDWTIQNCFIVREHVADDSLYAHNLPENLEVGPYVREVEYTYWFTNWVICLELSPSTQHFGIITDNVYTATIRFYFDDAEKLNSYINQLAEQGRLDDVVSVTMVPYEVSQGTNLSIDFTLNTSSIGRDNYVPKNKKLYSFPYRYIALNNNLGSENILQPNLFTSAKPTEIKIVLQFAKIGPQIIAVPSLYAGYVRSYNDGVMLDQFPSSTWSGDVFMNELVKNKYSTAYHYVSEALTLGASALTGNVSGVLNAANSIGADLAQMKDRSLYPYQIQGQQNAYNINIKIGRFGYTVDVMTPTTEYLKIIDDYFTHYGYTVNRFGVPNLKSRPYWNYIQTKQSRIIGDMPENFIRQIEDILNQGITFWHGGNVGNYNRNNS